MKSTLFRLASSSALAVLIFCLLLTPSFAESQQVKIGVGSSVPPFVLKNSEGGIAVDIIKQTLIPMGYEVEFIFLPNTRIITHLAERKLDGAINISPNQISDIYYSNDVLEFYDVAVTLRRKNISIKSIDDLSNKSIVAFQNARNVLGPKYKEVTGNNINYYEKSDQSMQLIYLYKERTEVIITELKVFQYFLSKLQSEHSEFSDLKQSDFYLHHIFPKFYLPFAFTSKKIRDDFNKGLKEIKTNGSFDNTINYYKKYHQIVNKYENHLP